MAHRAPIVVAGQASTLARDVNSLVVLVLELLRGRKPLEDLLMSVALDRALGRGRGGGDGTDSSSPP